jgi:hypothetical protein
VRAELRRLEAEGHGEVVVVESWGLADGPVAVLFLAELVDAAEVQGVVLNAVCLSSNSELPGLASLASPLNRKCASVPGPGLPSPRPIPSNQGTHNSAITGTRHAAIFDMEFSFAGEALAE